jgi:hypothetical protein
VTQILRGARPRCLALAPGAGLLPPAVRAGAVGVRERFTGPFCRAGFLTLPAPATMRPAGPVGCSAGSAGRRSSPDAPGARAAAIVVPANTCATLICPDRPMSPKQWLVTIHPFPSRRRVKSLRWAIHASSGTRNMIYSRSAETSRRTPRPTNSAEAATRHRHGGQGVPGARCPECRDQIANWRPISTTALWESAASR